jgi:glycosyltransferase involved in cell wall biosynthesis
MHWKVITHFLTSKDQPWIHHDVRSAHHSFDVIPADYPHDRSRKSTSGREWLLYLRQAVQGWIAAGRSPEKPVGFITAFPPHAVCVGLIKRLTRSKAPIIVWSFNLSQTFEGAKRRLAIFALARVDTFVVFSRQEVTTYSEMLGLPRERFRFIPFSQEMVAVEHPEETASPFIVALGTANRDYATLLDVVEQLGIRTIIVTGPHAVAGLQVPANVEIRSGLTEQQCNALCQQARLNIVPLDTRDTASGQVTVRNAMMFGKCLITTRSTGTEDYVEDSVTGVLVPPRDAAALKRAIEDLWDNPLKREAMGAAARAWIDQNAHYEVGPTRLLELMERAHVSAA